VAIQDEYIKTALRLPRHLHADISVSAENAGRSMNAEIIDRLAKSSDLVHLHRVIEQLTQTMQLDREENRNSRDWILTMFQQTIEVLKEALQNAEQMNATPEHLQRLRGEIARAILALDAFSPGARK